jgi:hypothetical protein
MFKFSTLVAPVMFSKTREKLVTNPNLSILNILTSLLQGWFYMAAAENHSEMPFSPARLRDIKWVPPSIRTSFSGVFSRA